MKENEKMGVFISQLIIIGFLWTSVYTFFTQTSMIAKTLAALGFIGFLYLIILSLKWTVKVFVQNKIS